MTETVRLALPDPLSAFPHPGPTIVEAINALTVQVATLVEVQRAAHRAAHPGPPVGETPPPEHDHKSLGFLLAPGECPRCDWERENGGS